MTSESAPADRAAQIARVLRLSVSLQAVNFALSFCQRQVRVGLDGRRLHGERLLPDELCDNV